MIEGLYPRDAKIPQYPRIDQPNNKIHLIISTDTEKAFDKINTPS